MNLLKKSYQNISSDEVNKIVKDKDVQIIDVREQYEFAAGHIETAKLIPLSTIPSRINEIDKNKKVIVVCASGARSTSASKYLGKEGYDTYNMVGGMMGWRYKTK
ncbi:MAG: sulfurtransferase [Firmicutes bacterium HGW-Firmicutes-3]|jgi:rhodanese-related sulfurtransferase|nr:MAG: sulfurtransferase [Firmicutes bacterium HGW-Firmicutes-3]